MQFTDKDPSEVVRLGVDFSNLLDTAETISTTAVSVRSAAGVAQPAMLSGSPTSSGSIVRQLITGGVAGMSYRVVFTVVTSTGQTLIEGADLRVSERA